MGYVQTINNPIKKNKNQNIEQETKHKRRIIIKLRSMQSNRNPIKLYVPRNINFFFFLSQNGNLKLTFAYNDEIFLVQLSSFSLGSDGQNPKTLLSVRRKI